MDKNIIKNHLTAKFLKEEETPGISVTKKAQEGSKKANKASVKDMEKDSLAYNKSLKQDKDTSKMAQNKFGYADDFQKDYHDQMEIMNGQEMIQYDTMPEKSYTDRATEAIEGSSRMGNNPEWANVVEKQKGFEGPEFGKNLVKKIKKSNELRGQETSALSLRGRDIQEIPAEAKTDNGSKPSSYTNGVIPGKKSGKNLKEEANNNNQENKESMKRLKFTNKFNGLGNALKLIPEGYRVDNKEFEMTDGNETYRIRWEGTLSEGRAVVLTAADKKMVSEDIKRMKELFGYKSENTLGLVKGNARLDENKVFGDIWNKSKQLLGEGEDIENAKTKEGNWEDETKKAPEATKHIEGKTSTDKGTQAPKAKEGNPDKAKSQASEATKHVTKGTAKATDKAKEGHWEDVKGGEKMMETEAPAAKEGHWEDISVSHAPEAKKHIEGSTSDDKGTQAPKPKEGHWEEVKKKASEATEHLESGKSTKAADKAKMVKENEEHEEEETPEEEETEHEEGGEEEGEGEEDSFYKSDEDDSETEKEPEAKEIGREEPKLGGDEDDIKVPMPKGGAKLMRSKSNGKHYLMLGKELEEVPEEMYEKAMSLVINIPKQAMELFKEYKAEQAGEEEMDEEY